MRLFWLSSAKLASAPSVNDAIGEMDPILDTREQCRGVAFHISQVKSFILSSIRFIHDRYLVI
jgi:hypothetical protein